MLTDEEIQNHKQTTERDIDAIIEQCVTIAWEIKWQADYDRAMQEA
jgi:hypothetical protein